MTRFYSNQSVIDYLAISLALVSTYFKFFVAIFVVACDQHDNKRITYEEEIYIIRKMDRTTVLMKWIFIYLCLLQYCFCARLILEEPSKSA